MFTCHRCGEWGHGYRECKRPPARTEQELAARERDILIRWDAGNGFYSSVKNELIAIERRAFKKEKETARK